MDNGFKINLGNYNDGHVHATALDCLKRDGKAFYSTQNAIRLHEWLGGTEALPLLLTKVDGTEPRLFGQTDTKELAPINIKELLSLEQTVMVGETFRPLEDDEDSKKRHLELARFNAGSILTDTQIPKRFVYSKMIVLDILVDLIVAQRNREVYAPKRLKLGFNVAHMSEDQLTAMGGCFGYLAMAIHANSFFDTKIKVEENLGLVENIFYQYAMAYSHATKQPIPMHYVVEEGVAFQQAVWYFTQYQKKFRHQVSKAEDTPINVVNIFSK